MHCPFCRNVDTRVLDSRVAEDGSSIRRRRNCPACEKRFTTVEQMQLMVLKRSGATEPFDRAKAISGVAKACKGRPVSPDDLACLGQQVEDAVRAKGAAEIAAHEVGMAICEPLRSLDEVAYLRFASVYKGFDSAEDFAREIASMMVGAADGELVEELVAALAASPSSPPGHHHDTSLVATTSTTANERAQEQA